MQERSFRTNHQEHLVRIMTDLTPIEGNLCIPDGAQGIVVFAFASASARHAPRNRYIAQLVQDAGLATLMIDLLTLGEEAADIWTEHLRTNVPLLTERMVGVTDWLSQYEDTQHLKIGYFGSDTVAAVALTAAAHRPDTVGAVVTRNGRPDLAEEALPYVQSPSLFIVGSQDTALLELNEQALAYLNTIKQLETISGAMSSVEDPKKVEQVAYLACNWFIDHLTPVYYPAADAQNAA
jgi:putative phosphoribosyl transferase